MRPQYYLQFLLRFNLKIKYPGTLPATTKQMSPLECTWCVANSNIRGNTHETWALSLTFAHMHGSAIFLCSPLRYYYIASRRALQIYTWDEESYSLTHSLTLSRLCNQQQQHSVRNPRKAKRNAAAKLLMSGWERERDGERFARQVTQPSHYCRLHHVLLPCLIVNGELGVQWRDSLMEFPAQILSVL
jgi:hypothetical protein